MEKFALFKRKGDYIMTLVIKQHTENGYYVIFEWDKTNIYRVAVCQMIDENSCGYPINEMT